MHMLLSNIYNEQGLFVTAREKGEQAYKMFAEIGDQKDIARAHNAIGNACSYMGNYTEAVKHFLAARKIFDQIHDTAGIINTYLELGAANDFNKNHEKALGYYTTALDLSLHSEESSNTVLLYNNIGLYHARKGNFEEALKCFEKAEAVGRNPEYAKARLSPLINLGKVYNAKGDNKRALEYLNEARRQADQLNLREPQCRALLVIGEIEANEHIPVTAALKEGLALAQQMGSKRLQAEFLAGLASVADRTGNYKEEVRLLKQARVLRDSLFNMNKTKEIANLQSEYELKQTSMQLAALEASEHRNAEKKNMIIVIAVVLTATLLSLMIIYARSHKLNIELSAREIELKKASAVKDRMLSIIGHDLKGPIGNIPSLLSIYKTADSDEEREFILNGIEESSIASLDTLEKLLTWGKQQIKGDTYQPLVLDVAPIMQSKLKLLGPAAANKGITIANKVPVGMRIYADENHFKFIMRNLISNAVKFTRSGGLVEISAHEHMENGHITFCVRDNGIGMDKEKQQHIFEPYNESTNGTANETGTSIGLMLCKEFVLQNGGNIWVESSREEGTTFSFTVRRTPDHTTLN